MMALLTVKLHWADAVDNLQHVKCASLHAVSELKSWPTDWENAQDAQDAAQ